MWDFNKYQSHIAIKDEFGVALTYGELHKENDKLYAVINRRCLTFCLCTNSIGSIVGYTAFIQNGIVPVLLNAHLEKELLNNLLYSYNPSYLWVPSEQVEEFDGMQAVYSAYEYTLLKTAYDKEYGLYPELCLMLTTSGSLVVQSLYVRVIKMYWLMLNQSFSILNWMSQRDQLLRCQ